MSKGGKWTYMLGTFLVPGAFICTAHSTVLFVLLGRVFGRACIGCAPFLIQVALQKVDGERFLSDVFIERDIQECVRT